MQREEATQEFRVFSMNICGIYKITSPIGRIYIGQSKNILQRWKRYYSLQCKNQHKIYASLQKYGINTHKFDIICQCDTKELNNLESYYIKVYNSFNSENGLNLTSGGSNASHSDEAKKKISIANKGRKMSEESIKNAIIGKRRLIESGWKNPLKGKKRPDISGFNNHNFGKKITDEQKRKRKETWKKKLESGWVSPQKGKTGKKGTPCSEENKQKTRERSLGNKYNLGKKHSEETIKKMRDARANIVIDINGDKNPFFGKRHSKKNIERFRIRKENKPVIKYDSLSLAPICQYISVAEAARIENIRESQISGCCHNKNGYITAGGFKWAFLGINKK